MFFKKEYGYAAESDHCNLLWRWRGFPFLSIQKFEIKDPVSKNGDVDPIVLYGLKVLAIGIYFRTTGLNFDTDPWDVN